jgi:protein TonB
MAGRFTRSKRVLSLLAKAIEIDDPIFPESERHNPIGGGKSTIYIIVDENGSPALISFKEAVPQDFDLAALEAISQWKFAPGMLNGAPVPVQIDVEVNFRLY